MPMPPLAWCWGSECKKWTRRPGSARRAGCRRRKCYRRAADALRCAVVSLPIDWTTVPRIANRQSPDKGSAMPLQLNDKEIMIVLTLAGPIDPRLQPQFLQEVEAELRIDRPASSARARSIAWLVRSNGNTLSRRSSARANRPGAPKSPRSRPLASYPGSEQPDARGCEPAWRA